MLRLLLWILAIAVVLAAAGGALWAWNEAAVKVAGARLEERRAYWTETLETALPIGATKDQAEDWLTQTVVKPRGRDKPDFQVGTRRYIEDADEVEAGGVRWPCSKWIIEVEVALGPDDKVVGRKVETVGSCV